jgi:hypothetical protein
MRSICVFHYHFRPGGVRQVIERTVPELLRSVVQTDRVVFLGGTLPDASWQTAMAELLAPRKVIFESIPELGYLAEMGTPDPRLRQILTDGVAKFYLRFRPKIVWAHNLSVGRNPLAALALAKSATEHGAILVCHHHDWWTEARWQRWPEMLQWGLQEEAEVAAATCPDGENVRHACVHPRDAAVLAFCFGMRTLWLPNMGPREKFAPDALTLKKAAEDLAGIQPYWLSPSRLLRRKNLLEAALLVQILGGRHFAVMGGPSSAGEMHYAGLLQTGADHLQLDLTTNLAGRTDLPPALVLALAEGALQTSLMEGWGLPGDEAAALGCPFLLRELPGLDHASASFSYKDLRLPAPPTPEEQTRLRRMRRSALEKVPPWWHPLCQEIDLDQPATAFSGLTPQGQLEFLKESAESGHAALLEANPWLKDWQRSFAQGRVSVSPGALPASKDRHRHSEELWLARFSQLLAASGPNTNPTTALTSLFNKTLPTAMAHPWLVG